MSKWPTVPLQTLFDVKSSKRVLKSEWRSEGVPFYRGREITALTHAGVVDNELFIEEGHYEDLKAKYGVAEVGDIVITAIGTIGNAFLIRDSEPFYFKDASVLWLKKRSDVSSEFVKHWLRSDSFIAQLQLGNGATVDTLTINCLAKMDFLLPPLEEQKRIVALLDAVFAKIAVAEEKQKAVARNAVEIFSSICDLQFPSSGRLNNSVRLPDVSENLDGKRRPITKDKRRSGPYRYFGASGVVDSVDDFIFDETLLLISEDGANLLARSSPIAFEVSGRCWVNNHAHVLRFNNHDLQKYVEYYFNHISLDYWITGAAQPKLTQSALNQIPIPISDDIDYVTTVVSSLDAAKEQSDRVAANAARVLGCLAEVKASVLRRAFEGGL